MVISLPCASDKVAKSSTDDLFYERKSLASVVNVAKHLLHLCCDADFIIIKGILYCCWLDCLHMRSLWIGPNEDYMDINQIVTFNFVKVRVKINEKNSEPSFKSSIIVSRRHFSGYVYKIQHFSRALHHLLSKNKTQIICVSLF